MRNLNLKPFLLEIYKFILPNSISCIISQKRRMRNHKKRGASLFVNMAMLYGKQVITLFILIFLDFYNYWKIGKIITII